MIHLAQVPSFLPGASTSHAAGPAPSASDLLDRVLAPYMIVFFVAFLVTLAATPLMRKLAVANGVVDWPDFKRKSHLEPVAYLGGLAIFLGWIVAVFFSMYCPSGLPLAGSAFYRVQFPPYILIGATLIMVIGLIDDVYGISPRVKIGGQLIAAAMLAMQHAGEHMLGAKLVLDTFASVGLAIPYLPAYLLGTAVIAFFVLGGCNAINLMDGLDGLATGITAISALAFLFIACALAQITLDNPSADPGADAVRVVMSLAMLGALLGFLPWNFNPANIFMGDAGSLLLGYLCIANILLFAAVGGQGPMYVMAGLIVLTVPIADTVLAILRRKLRGLPISAPDNNHLHHQIRKSGLSVRSTVLVLYGFSAFFAAIGASLVFLRWRYVIAVFLVLFSFLVVMAYKIGHRQHLVQKLAQNPDPSTPPPPPA